MADCKLVQALVYDILPSAVFSYGIGSRKQCQLTSSFFYLFLFFIFLVGAKAVVSLLQTTQLISDVCFTTDHRVAYARSNKTKTHLNRNGTLFVQGVDAPHVYVGTRLFPQYYECPNLSEGADRVRWTAARR